MIKRLSKKSKQIAWIFSISFFFENIYTQKIKKEKIIDFKNEIIYLENWEKLVLDEWRVFE